MGQRLNARIDDELAQKLRVIRQRTKQTTTEVLKASIELYYDVLTKAPREPNTLLSHHFVGCAEGPSDLSSRYKDELHSFGDKT